MSTPCQTTWNHAYDPTHNPFLFFSDIRYNSSRCDAHLVNSAQFNSSVSSGSLPSFSFYVPDVYNDGEYSNVSYADHWLRGFLAPILNSSSSTVRSLVGTTAFLIVYDEALNDGGFYRSGVVNSYCENVTGNSYATCGGQVYLAAVSPDSHGGSYPYAATDYNLASTIEWLLGVGGTGGYDNPSEFPAMTSLF
jgi:hypothetical protein